MIILFKDHDIYMVHMEKKYTFCKWQKLWYKYGYHGDILKNVYQPEVDLPSINKAVLDKAG